MQKKKQETLVNQYADIKCGYYSKYTFVVLAPWLIGLLTFNRYVDATPYVQIITLSNITTACYYMIVNIIVGFGYTNRN